MSNWLFGGLGIVIALIGLFLAAGARDTGIAVHGYMLAAFGVGLNFWLIRNWNPSGTDGGR
jgi:hypothetical protein